MLWNLLSTALFLLLILVHSALQPDLGRVPCCDQRAVSCDSHSPAFPLLRRWERVGWQLHPPFLLCQAWYWPQEPRHKVCCLFQFINSDQFCISENGARFTEAGILAVFCSRTDLSNTAEWPWLCSYHVLSISRNPFCWVLKWQDLPDMCHKLRPVTCVSADVSESCPSWCIKTLNCRVFQPGGINSVPDPSTFFLDNLSWVS